MIHNKSGYWYFGVGSLLLVLVVVYVFIDGVNPHFGQTIADSIRQLFGSVGG